MQIIQCTYVLLDIANLNQYLRNNVLKVKKIGYLYSYG